jgi:hypothetical protein
MSEFDPLTDGEFRRLVNLEQQLRQAQAVTDDDVRWHFIDIMGGSHIRAIRERDINRALASRGQRELEAVAVDELHLKRWAETGYISVLPSRDNDFGIFLLTPRGLEYLAYCRKNRIARWFIDCWSDLRTEVVSAIVSAVISIVVSLATAYLVLTFGLK